MLWQSNTPLSPQPNEGTQLPATFGDTFDTSWREGLLVTSGITQNNARAAALDNYLDEVRQTSGQDIGATVGSDLQFPQLRLDAARDAVSKLKQDKPGLQIPDLTDDELDRRAASIAGLSHDAFAEMSAREKTFGGKLGMLAGGLLAGAGDPLNLIFAPVPEAKLGIVATAALWAGLGTESAAINELVNAQFRERAIPGYIASGAPAANIAESAAGGVVLGGLFKGASTVWSRMKTGEWPRSVRDAGNIVESEANIQASNVLPGVEGAAAHREALGKAIDDIVAGKPVEVPERVGALMDDSTKTTFTTAKGSTYQVADDGTTIRDKALREDIGHEGDQGLKPKSERTVYLDADQFQKLATPEGNWRFVDHGDGTISLATPNKRGGWGISPSARAVPYSETPEIGKIPLELWNPKDTNGMPGFSKAHFGNEIVDVSSGRPLLPSEPPPLLPTAAKPNIVSPPETPDLGGAISGPAGEIKLIREKNVADDAHLYTVNIGGKNVAELHIEDYGNSLNISYVTSLKKGSERFGSIGNKNIMGIINELKNIYPNAQEITGTHISGAGTTYENGMFSGRGFGKDVRININRTRAFAEQLTPAAMQQTLADPAHATGLIADLERIRDTGTKPQMVAIGTDAAGEPQYQLLDAAIQEAKDYESAASQIESCVNPPAEE